MNKPRIPRIAAVFAIAAAAFALGITTAAVTDDGSDHPAAGSLAVTSGAVALAGAAAWHRPPVPTCGRRD